jgi:8-oxo-dGTP pyrophosphatase MutT (NUDIX family)
MTNGTRLCTAPVSQGLSYVGSGILLMRLGAVAGEPPRFLLLRGRDTGIWSFSKGHPEEEDAGNPLQTALRETREETGYEIDRDYTLVSDTSIRLGKRPYWVGIMTVDAAPRPRLAACEHSDSGWFTWSEVSRLPTNTDVRAWVKKAAVATSGFARLMASSGLGLELVLPEERRSPECSSKLPTRLTAPVCIAI